MRETVTERSDVGGDDIRLDSGPGIDGLDLTDTARQLLFHGRLLDRAAAMRPMQATVCRLAAVMVDPDCSIEDVAKELRLDPPLVAALLKEAYSAASAPVAGISSIQAAATRLGLARVLAVAAGSMVGPTAQRSLEAYQLGPGGLWDHSILSSYVAEAIYGMGRDGIGPEVVASALLHHMGKIILNDILEPSQFHSAIMVNGSSDAAERELIDVDHAEMGAVLLEMWNLPASITEPIRFHHAPDRTEWPAAHVVNIASIIGRELGGIARPGGPDMDDLLLDASLEALSLEREAVVHVTTSLLVLAGRIPNRA